MKLEYFLQQEADGDDVLLREFKALKVVPIGCLLGGQIVKIAHDQSQDPCERCPGPRARCKGRPRKDRRDGLESDTAAASIFSNSRDAIQLAQIERAQQLQELLEAD